MKEAQHAQTQAILVVDDDGDDNDRRMHVNQSTEGEQRA